MGLGVGKRKELWALVLMFAITSGGCTMSPKYIRPAAPIPNAYDARQTEMSTSLAPWEVFFPDQAMRHLIRIALDNNRDVRVSLLNIDKHRAQYRIQRADTLPTMNTSGEASSRHLPASLSTDGVKGVSRQYTMELGFTSFELDIFGRIRSLTEQSLENYYSVEEEARSARLSLIAESASLYLQLVADRELYDVTAATVENRRQNFEIIRSLFDEGAASGLELSQAQTILDEARVSLAVADTTVTRGANSLALLLGRAIPADIPEVRKLADIPSLPDVSEGIPSALLERRPDILAAEHVLKGANANIGAARANFFPSISLTGTFGKISTDYANLWDGTSKSWSFLPQITLPIFDMGRNTAHLKVAEADRDIAVARYEKAIQNAFREVADALGQRDTISAQLEAQQSLVSACERSYLHARARYETGVSSYIDVLEAERALFAARSNLIAARLLREANVLALYKALGGGWEPSWAGAPVPATAREAGKTSF